MPIFHKTIELVLTDKATDEAKALVPGNAVWEQPVEHVYSLKILVDGQPTLEISEFRGFSADTRNIAEMNRRLNLLQQILRQADYFGTAVVKRENGFYELADPTKVQVNDES